MFEVHQVKVHIFGIQKCLQQCEKVNTNKVDIYNILYIRRYPSSLNEMDTFYYISYC